MEVALLGTLKYSEGTLCIAIAANIAKTGLLSFDACIPDIVVGLLSARPGMAEYVRAVLSFHQKRLKALTPGSAQKNINLSVLRNLEVPDPSDVVLDRFRAACNQLGKECEVQAASAAELDALFASLQARTFRGEL